MELLNIKKIEDVFKERRSSLIALPSVDRLIVKLVSNTPGCWIAGGAALALYTRETLHIKDWDVFGSEEAINHLRQTIEKEGFRKIGDSDFGETYGMAGVLLQLITYREVFEVQDIFAFFDFTTCCVAIGDSNFYYTEEARVDVENKVVNILYITNIVSTIKRIARYGKKGYTPSDKCAKDIATYLKNMDPGKLENMASSSGVS